MPRLARVVIPGVAKGIATAHAQGRGELPAQDDRTRLAAGERPAPGEVGEADGPTAPAVAGRPTGRIEGQGSPPSRSGSEGAQAKSAKACQKSAPKWVPVPHSHRCRSEAGGKEPCREANISAYEMERFVCSQLDDAEPFASSSVTGTIWNQISSLWVLSGSGEGGRLESIIPLFCGSWPA